MTHDPKRDHKARGSIELDRYISDKQRRRKQRGAYVAWGLVVIAIYLIVVGGFWIALRTPLFRVQAVTVTGNVSVPSEEVITLLQSAAGRDRSTVGAMFGLWNMLGWPEGLSAKDLTFDPRLMSVSVNRDYWSHAIAIHVQERTAVAIWCFMAPGPGSGDCFWFDQNGFMFGRALDLQGGSLFSVHDEAQSPRQLAQYILPEQFIPNLITILDVLKASGVGVQAITLSNLSQQEISVTTAAGPTLYFSLRFPANEDLAVLQDFLNKPNFAALSYIDFRVEHRVYSR